MRIKRRSWLKMSGSAVSSIGIAGCLSDTGSDTITLRYTSFVAENHHIEQTSSSYFMEEVTKRTDDQVQFEPHYATELGGAAEQSKLIQDGAADIGMVSSALESENYPLAEVVGTPGGRYSSVLAGSEAYTKLLKNELFNKTYKDNNLKPVWGGVILPYRMMLSDGRLDAADDWEGLKIRTPGGVISNSIDALGANPVPLNPSEMYNALKEGTVDGIIVTIRTVGQGYSLHEVLDPVLTNYSMGGAGIYIPMNLEKFNSLSSEIQDVIQEVGQETVQHYSNAADAAQEDTIEQYSDRLDFYEVSDDLQSSWDSQIESVTENWISDLEERDVSAQEVFDEYKSYLEQSG